MVAPVVVGGGPFPDGHAPAGLRLVSSESTPGGLVIQVYAWAGEPAVATQAGFSDIV